MISIYYRNSETYIFIEEKGGDKGKKEIFEIEGG
jgi:hypothetical protein